MSKRRRNPKKRLDNMRRSERSKYLDTMMADMGIGSLQELGSNEERNRWIKAVTPHPIVEKKLREMGHDMTGNSNIRSLGSKERLRKIFSFYKKADTATQATELTGALADLRSVVTPDTSYAILAVVNEPKMMQSPDFDGAKLKTDLDAAIAAHEDDPASFQYYVQNLVDKITKYNSAIQRDIAAENPSSGAGSTDYAAMRQYFINTEGIDIRRGHTDRGQVRFIQNKLETLGYTLNRLGANGEFDEQTEDAILLFQEHNNLPATGQVDDRMIDRLFANPTPLPTGTRREHRRRVRQEQRGSQVGQEVAQTPAEPTTGETPTFQNIEYTSSRVDIAGASPMLRAYLKLLGQAAAEVGGKIQITSAFRNSFDQSRIMYNNYSARARRGSPKNAIPRANRYLLSLYRRFNGIDDIANLFAGGPPPTTEDEAKAMFHKFEECHNNAACATEKRKKVEEVIENQWHPRNGHRAGFSIDVRLGSKVKEILEASQDLATVDILRESDHFHVTVKSLEPGGIPRGKIRRFNA